MYLLGDVEKRLAGGFKSSGGECGTDVNPVADETELADTLTAALVRKVADELATALVREVADELAALIEGEVADKLAAVLVRKVMDEFAAVVVEREAVRADAKGVKCDVESTEKGKLAFCEGSASMEPIRVGAGSYHRRD